MTFEISRSGGFGRLSNTSNMFSYNLILFPRLRWRLPKIIFIVNRCLHFDTSVPLLNGSCQQIVIFSLPLSLFAATEVLMIMRSAHCGCSHSHSSCELKATTLTDGHCKVTILLKLVTVNHLSPLTTEASHVVFGLSFCW
jgi:hypothetical protein